MAAVRDEKVDEMIQGDLSESRVVLAHDVRLDMCRVAGGP
jgi:hypothetical protein